MQKSQKEELKDEENRLKDFEKDLSKLVKKNEDLHSDIENYKEKIIKAEKEIEKNFDRNNNVAEGNAPLVVYQIS